MKRPFRLTIAASSVSDLREQAEMIGLLADILDRGITSGSARVDVASLVLDRFSTGAMSFDFSEAALATVMSSWPNGALFQSGQDL